MNIRLLSRLHNDVHEVWQEGFTANTVMKKTYNGNLFRSNNLLHDWNRVAITLLYVLIITYRQEGYRWVRTHYRTGSKNPVFHMVGFEAAMSAYLTRWFVHNMLYI